MQSLEIFEFISRIATLLRRNRKGIPFAREWEWFAFDSVPRGTRFFFYFSPVCVQRAAKGNWGKIFGAHHSEADNPRSATTPKFLRLDSNQDCMDQNHVCYRYTTEECNPL